MAGTLKQLYCFGFRTSLIEEGLARSIKINKISNNYKQRNADGGGSVLAGRVYEIVIYYICINNSALHKSL